MEENKTQSTAIDAYIAGFPAEVQQIMTKIRVVIHEAAPEATEKFSYAMPGFYYHGNLVWFGGHTHHIGFYPGGTGIEAFKAEISAYKWSKGAVQFPLDKPVPYDLITKIVQFRAAENLQKSSLKKKK